jgi:hypothetical protein
MLIALRDSISNEVMKTQIEDMYLKNPTSTFGDKIKLKQVTRDWDAYRALVNKSDQLPGKITDGYKYFISKIDTGSYSAEEHIKALSRINVACIFLDERPYKGEDPQIIFETLNSLGKPLSFADLIRNYVMLGMPSHDQTEIYENKWFPNIEDALQDRASHFFRDYMQYKESKYFKVVSDNNTKELYSFFTHFVKKLFRLDKIAFIDDLQRYVPLYQLIIEIDPNVTISCEHNTNKVVLELLRNIFHDIKADAFKPLVLGLLEYHQYGFDDRKISDDQLIEALKVIRTYLIRRRVLKLTQGENKSIAGLCDEIRGGNASLLLDTRAEMLQLLSRGVYRLRFPNDSEVTNELKRIDFYNGLSKYIKFILGKIEEHLSKVSVDFRDKRITIEHIMPQSIERNKDWKAEIGENWLDVYKTYLHNIGNLILTEFNSEMGKKPLHDKKMQLMQSNLQYRNDVLQRTTWNEDDILTHQSEMINRFLMTFSLPVIMQQAENWDVNKPTTEQDTISPLDDEVGDAVTNRSPNAILINDELFEVSTWQDAYLAVLRWLITNKPIAFSEFLKQNEGNTKHPLVAVKSDLASLIKDDPIVARKYKRLSDGLLYSGIQKESEENPFYVHINQSARYLIMRIGHAMTLADMAEDSVTIELRP